MKICRCCEKSGCRSSVRPFAILQRNEGGEDEDDDDVLLFIKLGKATDGRTEEQRGWEDMGTRIRRSRSEQGGKV